jgi:hypothetical protein
MGVPKAPLCNFDVSAFSCGFFGSQHAMWSKQHNGKVCLFLTPLFDILAPNPPPPGEPAMSSFYKNFQ